MVSKHTSLIILAGISSMGLQGSFTPPSPRLYSKTPFRFTNNILHLKKGQQFWIIMQSDANTPTQWSLTPPLSTESHLTFIKKIMLRKYKSPEIQEQWHLRAMQRGTTTLFIHCKSPAGKKIYQIKIRIH